MKKLATSKAMVALAGATVLLAASSAHAVPKFNERVVFVSGDDTAVNNGTTLLDSIDDIVNGKGPCSSPGPSAANPCLIKLGPGVFDLDDATLFMVPHVDIEGSGEGVPGEFLLSPQIALISYACKPRR